MRIPSTRLLYFDYFVPHRFIGLHTLVREMAAYGYRLIVRAPHVSPIRGVMGPLPVGNLASSMQVRYASSVLFEDASETGGAKPPMDTGVIR